MVVVVGVAFDAAGDEAIRAALNLTRGKRAEIHVLHALSKENSRKLTPSRLDALDRRIEGAASRLRTYARKHGLNSGVRRSKNLLHVRFDTPASALVQLAVDVDADLLVVGSRGLRGVARLVLGSVASEVAKRAPCPVLIARAKDHGAIRRSPQIEPPCKACVAARMMTNGADWWCARHAKRHRLPMHVYSYQRRLPLAVRDSEVLGATGTRVPRIG
jgi:nucleotide-binding universal stress UspA family protein